MKTSWHALLPTSRTYINGGWQSWQLGGVILADQRTKRRAITSFIRCHVSSALQVFGGTRITQHRWHAARSIEFVGRLESHDSVTARLYYHQDCPGIDDSASQKPIPDHRYPPIHTFLAHPQHSSLNRDRTTQHLPTATRYNGARNYQ